MIPSVLNRTLFKVILRCWHEDCSRIR